MKPAPAPEPADLPARLRGVFPAEQIIETHISWVFLTLEYAYKVKKPVDLDFLDFRPLARRRHFCEEEVRLTGDRQPLRFLSLAPEDSSSDRSVSLGAAT